MKMLLGLILAALICIVVILAVQNHRESGGHYSPKPYHEIGWVR